MELKNSVGRIKQDCFFKENMLCIKVHRFCILESVDEKQVRNASKRELSAHKDFVEYASD